MKARMLIMAASLAVALSGCAKIKGAIEQRVSNDGTVLGLVPDEQAAAWVDKVSGPGGDWLRNQSGMVALVKQIPQGLPVYYGIRNRATGQFIDLTDFESVIQFAPIVTQLSAQVPRLGNHVTPTPYLVPKPPALPVFTNAPPAPTATNAPATPQAEPPATPKARANDAATVTVTNAPAPAVVPPVVLPTNAPAAPVRFTIESLPGSNAPPAIVNPQLESIISEGL